MYTYNARVLNVVDGDTIDVLVDLGFDTSTTQRLRLAGIDTPERGQPGYAEAKDYLKNNKFPEGVVIKTTKKDSFGRWIATIWEKNEYPGDSIFSLCSINEKLLNLNLAVPYEKRKR